MPRTLLVYTTRAGETKKIGELIAEGIRFSGAEAKVVNASEIKKEADLEGYDAVVFGSPTYHGQMMQGMQTLLFLAEKAHLEGKAGGAFGAFGWSGEAVRLINAIMEEMKFTVIDPGINIQYVPAHDDLRKCVDLGHKVAEALKERA